MYVDECENYSETELKNRASVYEQRQFNAVQDSRLLPRVIYEWLCICHIIFF